MKIIVYYNININDVSFNNVIYMYFFLVRKKIYFLFVLREIKVLKVYFVYLWDLISVLRLGDYFVYN